MSGVLDAYEGDPTSPVLAPREAADTRPVSWWSAAQANWRLAQDDDEAINHMNLLQGYGALEDALVEAGYPRSRYHAPGTKPDQGVVTNDVFSRFLFGRDLGHEGSSDFGDQMWQDVEAVRKRNPQAFANIPKTKKEFETWAYSRMGERGRDIETAAQGGFGSAILPGLGWGLANITSPENLAQMPLGGGAKTVGGFLAKQFAVGMLGQAIQTPQIVYARENMGEGYSGSDLGRDLVIGGMVNTVFAGALAGAVPAAKAGGAGVDRLRSILPDRQLANDFRRAVPDEFARTPEQASALNIVERSADIDEANPYRLTYSAMEAHVERLQALQDQLEALPRPATPQLAPAAQAPAATAAPGFDSAWQAIIGIEGGTNRDGSFRTSSAGAIGPAQMMPGTAKQAAQLAGLPFDPVRLRSDHAYNVALGQAYYRHLLQQFDGDAEKAAAAYNAGPGSAKKGNGVRGAMAKAEAAGAPDQWERYLPAETQAYVENFRKRTGSSPAEPMTVDMPVLRPDALDAVRPQLVLRGKQIELQQFSPDEIGVDAPLMQFKSGSDQYGVTDRLRGLKIWDTLAAGTVTVWEALDGRRLIADGHQRLGLARRIMAEDPGQNIKLNAFVLREADGFSASNARVITALTNIGQGTGSAADAAKVFREVGLDPERLKSLPPKSPLIRDGRALANLSDEAFGAVINAVIPENYGAAIGALAPDPATHIALVGLLADAEPANRLQAEAIVRQALDAGFHSEEQMGLFGTSNQVSSTFKQKARLLDKTLSELRKLKGAFSVASRNSEALDQAGNRIDVVASDAEVAANAKAIGLVDALALKTGNAVNDLFNRAAQRLAAGEPLATVTRDVVADLRQLDLERALRDAGGSLGPDAAGRSANEVGAEAQAGEGEPGALTAAERDELEAAGQGGFTYFDEPAHKALDDPAGKGVEEIAQSVWHDVRAANEQPVLHPTTGETIDQVHARSQQLREAHPAAPGETNPGTHNIAGSTPLPDGRTRAELRADIVKQMMAAPAEQAREAHVVLGPPAAGKSSFADPLAAARGLRIIDSDTAKAMLPEYSDGVGAMAVHEESARLAQEALQRSIDQGDNVLLPLIGKTYGNIENTINDLVKQNYRVYVHLVDLPINKAEGRAIARFSRSGRFVDPAYVRGVGDRPRATYDRVVSQFGDQLEGYSHVSNDVARGEAPRQIAAGGRAADGLRSGAGTGAPENGGRPGSQSAGEPGAAAEGAVSRVSLDSGAAVDPNIAAHQLQQAQLGADAPMRANTEQDGTMGSPLFDAADAPRFDLGDGKGERTIAEIEAELDADAAAVNAIKGCLL